MGARGKLEMPSKDEIVFWGEFPGLLIDDKEIIYNDLVILLRRISIRYWEKISKESK